MESFAFYFPPKVQKKQRHYENQIFSNFQEKSLKNANFAYSSINLNRLNHGI